MNYGVERIAKDYFTKGWNYEHGIGVRADEKTALDWYKKAAGLGYELAINRLNILNQRQNNNRTNIASDNEKNENSVLSDNNIKDSIVSWIVAEFKKENGIDLTSDKMAMKRLHEAAEKAKVELSRSVVANINLPFITGNAEGPKHIDMNLNREKLDEITTKYVEKANKGPQCNRNQGEFMQEDYEREKLAKQYYSKGWSYEHGIGVSVDKNFALVWYEKAADLGYEMAINRLHFLNVSYQKAQTNSSLNRNKEALILATFAIGTYVAYLDDDKADVEVEVIDRRLKELYKKYGMKAIEVTSDQYYSDFFNFDNIKQKYLNNLSDSDLKDLNSYILDIIKADNVIAKEELCFLNNEWAPYLKERLGVVYKFDSLTVEINKSNKINISNEDGRHYYEKAYKYENGIGVKVDKNFANLMYEKAAACGYQPAVNKLNSVKNDGYNESTKHDKYADLKAVTGFTAAECAALIKHTNWTPNQASSNIKTLLSTAASATEKEAIAASVREAGLYSKLGDNISKLNTMRGGVKGFKGFVAEEMQATEATLAGKTTRVINDNGIADLEYIGKNGHHYYQQMKVGYKPGQINFAKYKGQTVVVDKGNPYLKQLQAEGRKHGVKVVEGHVTNQEAKELADMMQKETALTGQKTSTAVPTAVKAKHLAQASHKAGMQSAKAGAAGGFGFSLGTNIVDVMSGDKELGDAAGDIAKDTAIGGAVGYTVGFAGTAIGSTSVGAAAFGAASAAGSAVAGTAVGGAVIGAGTATAAAIGGAGAAATGAVVGAVGAAGSAVGGAAVAATAGTAIGGAVATGVGAAAAGAAAVGAAAVAAAPVVAVAAAAGIGYKLLKKIFW